MCHTSCMEFGSTHLKPEDVSGKSIIEVGALDINGSLRPVVERLLPASYLGVDITMGPGVDEICDAGSLAEKYGPTSFDVVIATELLEHTRDWRRVVSNLKRILRPGGVLLITTRSRGYRYHGFPYDFWRYEVSDIRAIFADLTIEELGADPEEPGVFLKARKPVEFVEKNLSEHRLFSMVRKRPADRVTAIELLLVKSAHRMRPLLARTLPRSVRKILSEKVLGE